MSTSPTKVRLKLAKRFGHRKKDRMTKTLTDQALSNIHAFKEQKDRIRRKVTKIRERMLNHKRSQMLDTKMKIELSKLAVACYRKKVMNHRWGVCKCRNKTDIPITRYNFINFWGFFEKFFPFLT